MSLFEIMYLLPKEEYNSLKEKSKNNEIKHAELIAGGGINNSNVHNIEVEGGGSVTINECASVEDVSKKQSHIKLQRNHPYLPHVAAASNISPMQVKNLTPLLPLAFVGKKKLKYHISTDKSWKIKKNEKGKVAPYFSQNEILPPAQSVTKSVGYEGGLPIVGLNYHSEKAQNVSSFAHVPKGRNSGIGGGGGGAAAAAAAAAAIVNNSKSQLQLNSKASPIIAGVTFFLRD